MNRSIIWNIDNKSVCVNKKVIFYFGIFKFLKITTINIKKEYDIKLSKSFKKKIDRHHNAKFLIISNGVNFYKNVYLTCNTNNRESNTSEHIGKIDKDGELKDQFINYNYKVYTTEKSDMIFEENIDPYLTEVNYKIENLLKKSNKIEIIEYKLSKGFDFFSSCIKHTKKIDNCYQQLMIEHSENAQLISKLFFYDVFL